jgi:hypothetical protein
VAVLAALHRHAVSVRARVASEGRNEYVRGETYSTDLHRGHFVLGIIIGAAILGIIIAAMEGDEFPGWGKMVICVLAAAIPTAILNAVVPPELFFIPILVGAGCAMVAIMATCGMSAKRAGIAAGIYFAVQIVVGLAFAAIFRT